MLVVALLVLFLPISSTDEVNRKQTMRILSLSIGKKYFECNKMKHYSKDVYKDMVYFWDPGWELTHTEDGCAIKCVADDLRLIDKDLQIIKPHAKAFLEAHDADTAMINIMFELYTYCHDTIADKIKNTKVSDCWTPLEFIRCARDGIQDMGWVPDVSDKTNPIKKTFRRFFEEKNNIKQPTRQKYDFLRAMSIKWNPANNITEDKEVLEIARRNTRILRDQLLTQNKIGSFNTRRFYGMNRITEKNTQPKNKFKREKRRRH